MTISLAVLLLECTGDITFSVPIIFSLFVSKWIADFFNPVGIKKSSDIYIYMLDISVSTSNFNNILNQLGISSFIDSIIDNILVNNNCIIKIGVINQIYQITH